MKQGAAMLGWELDALLDKTLQAMQETENEVKNQIETTTK